MSSIADYLYQEKRKIPDPATTNNDLCRGRTDERETLFNQGDCGPIEHIQVSTERIVSLRGILFDLDPDIYVEGAALAEVPEEPTEFYGTVVEPMLGRHPVLAKAEVRNSGRGLHAILWFDKPVEFSTEGERDRWAGIVKVVQAALPIDPDQPGITATTRAVGSTNGKNGAVVTVLTKGEPVTEEEVLGLYGEMIQRPFCVVTRIITGSEAVEPCPICGKEDTKLLALNHNGQCYGSCGQVNLERLYDLVLKPRESRKGAKSDG